MVTVTWLAFPFLLPTGPILNRESIGFGRHRKKKRRPNDRAAL